MLLNVIICTWNPRQTYLSRTLAGLEKQSLPANKWDLLVVDNNSSPPISERGFKLPPNARIVREPTPGLTAARLCGIAESSAPLLVFVDDDNVLAPDYLEKALEIAQTHPRIGVFGGRSLPEFEIPPPDWMKPFWPHLALHDFPADRWTNQFDSSCFPCGAGMCLRASAAEKWAQLTRKNASADLLGRKGGSLASGEDTDMVHHTLASGFGTGKFTRLSLLHLIPKERLTLDYHRRLAHGMGLSLGYLNASSNDSPSVGLMANIRLFMPVVRAKGLARQVRWAAFKAYRQGLRQGWALRQHQT